jgi:hypothetical protein
MNKVGAVGFIVILCAVFIWIVPDASQKKEIIDMWLLFKNPMSINILLGFNFLQFVILIFHNYHYRNKVSFYMKRLDDAVEEKRSLQQRLMDGPLNSSK